MVYINLYPKNQSKAESLSNPRTGNFSSNLFQQALQSIQPTSSAQASTSTSCPARAPILKRSNIALEKKKLEEIYVHASKLSVVEVVEDLPPFEQPQSKQSEEQTKFTLRQPKSLQPQQIQKKCPIFKPQEKESDNVKELSLGIPKKKHYRQGGTRGQKLTVESNHIALNINPKFETAFHYDISIIPDKPKRLFRNIWETFRNDHLKNYPLAFDGVKNVYSPKYLFDSFCEEVVVCDNLKRMSFRIVMKYAAEINLRALFDYMASGCVTPIPQNALQCVDVVLRNVCSMKFVKVGRCFFSEPTTGRIMRLGDGMDLWLGHFQSAIIGWKPFLNIDITNKAFPTPQPVIDLMLELCKGDLSFIGEEALKKIETYLKGLKVLYEVPNQPSSRRNYRVNGLVGTPDRSDFVTNGQRISVLQYFAQHKKYRIKYSHLPLLWVGSKERNIYLPAELCSILSGQVTNKLLNETQTSNMIKHVTTNTKVRKEMILASLKQINFNNDPVVNAFGLEIGQEFERIPARLLPSPSLEYKDEKIIKPQKGVWKPTEFLQAQNLENNSWTIMNLDRRINDDSLEYFARMIAQSARQLGMQIQKPLRPYPVMQRFNPDSFEQFLMNNKNLKIIFVIIPEYPLKIYDQVKQKAELFVGNLTQCIRSKTINKMNQSTVINILQKVNSKLNGHNHTIARIDRPPCLKRPCIIMGADVTHPSPDQNDVPSIAAVTASCDPRAFQYNFSWRLQPPRQEIIQDLEAIVREQLIFFRKASNQIPQRIFFFRDGVSEGQFKMVMNEEMQAIRRACSSLGTPGSFKPAITFLVVQKRHHTRFFPTNPMESDDRNGNVRAGTVVDTHITHPTDIEYYLVSHASIQGVARPTKYRVLWDDHDTSEDELQALTYYLCHMFSRCTRSVSYPAPTYYAHLAALRARAYLDRLLGE